MARGNARRKASVEVSIPRRGRMIAVMVLLTIGFATLVARAAHLQLGRYEDFAERKLSNSSTSVTIQARRGEIRDRHGAPLAINADAPSIYVAPISVREPGRAVDLLADVFQIERAWLERRVSGSRQFRWVKRHVTPDEAARIESAGIDGLGVAQEPRRYYPQRALAGHILGFVDRDGKGLEGIERDFDRHLRGKQHVLDGIRDARGQNLFTGGYLPPEELSGHHVVLTIDARIQQIAEAVLVEQVREMEARNGGVVVVMDPYTGDILALAQQPTFDPNFYASSEKSAWRNRAAVHLLEPGSTIKPILVAAALDAGKVKPDTVFDGMKGRMRIGRKIVRDVHAEKWLTTYQVVQKSSNIGAVQIAQRLGRDLYHSYLRAFGFGESTNSGLRGELTGRLRSPRRWGQIHLATHAYGYGLSVTPLQMTLAIGAIANGGHLMRPRMVNEIIDARGEVVERFPVRQARRVISERAATEATEAMIMVTQKEGTARRARVPGYVVAGKTGTAHKVDVGGYSHDKVIASFVGFVPAHNPKLLIYVAIDEPMAAQYGGVVAAPIFRDIAREVLPYLGVEPTEPIDAADLDDSDTLAEEDDRYREPLDPLRRAWWLEMPDVTGGPAHQVVPELREHTPAEVVAIAAEMGVEVEIEGEGLVVGQKPQPGALLAPGDTLRATFAMPGRMHRPGDGRRGEVR